MISCQSLHRIGDDEIILNGAVVAKGAVSTALYNKIEYDDFGDVSQDITIKGILETGYYLQDINTIETNRYYIEGVTVLEEHYGSSENKIVYVFQARMFQVKFQDQRDQYYEIKTEETNEENDDWSEYLT